MNKYIPSILLSLALSAPLHAAVTAGDSSARDLTVSVGISGTLLGDPVTVLSLSAGPVNEAAGTAPAAYSVSPALAGAAAATTGILELNLEVEADTLTADSDVDGLGETGFASSSATISSASVSLGADGVPLSILTLELTTTSALVSNASVSWDGTSFNPGSTSSFLTSGGALSLNILGLDITIPALVANVETVIPVNLSALGVSVTGSILLTVDAVSSLVSGDTATATASSVLLTTDLNVTVPLGVADVAVDGTIALNQTTASLTAVPVPEPTAAALAAASGLMLMRRRRR